MCEGNATPLARLSEECAKCLRLQGQQDCDVCRELAYRALCDDNDAAWDLLLVHLWPLILRGIYARQPEASPAVAQSLGYRALRLFRRQCANRSDLATNFPTFPTLLAILNSCLLQVITPGADGLP
jgi:hypothetical protein